MRDIEANPYSADEARVAKFFVEKIGLGGGDDPVGSLIASHEYVVAQRNQYRSALKKILAIEDREWGGDWDEIEEAREIAHQALADSH